MKLTAYKKHLKKASSLLLALSMFVSQNLFADSKGPSTAAAVNIANLEAQAFEDTNKEIEYVITLSDGESSEDLDVMIARASGPLYSFKYCKAHNPDGSPTDIANLRKLLLLQPQYFQKPESQNILGQYFMSPICSFFTASKVYAHKFSSDGEWDPMYNDRGSLLSPLGLATGVTGIAFSGKFITKAAQNFAENNALSKVKFIFSKHFPKLWLLGSIAMIGLTGESIHWYSENSKNEQDVNVIENSSSYQLRMSLTQTVQVKVDSMKDFQIHFLRGLEILIQDGIFVEF